MIFRDYSIKSPPIMAEIGLSHEGSLGYALSWIDSAVEAGADIVKFQIHYGDDESTILEEFRTNFSVQDKTRKDYWDRTGFTDKDWTKIKNYCDSKKIYFTASPFSVRAIKILRSLNVKILKIGSGEFMNEEFGEALADFDGILILSTGLAREIDISKTINYHKNKVLNNKVILMQCTSMYPTPLEYSGAHMIKYFENKFQVPFGFSDHTIGLSASKIALVSGAKIIERHVTYDLRMFGPDSSSSITFGQLKELVEFRDDLAMINSTFDKNDVTQGLKDYRRLFGRSLSLNRDLPKGHVLRVDDFTLKKPGGGEFSWSDKTTLIGKKLISDTPCNVHLASKHLEE